MWRVWMGGAGLMLLAASAMADELKGEAGAGVSWQPSDSSGSRHAVKPMPYLDLTWHNLDLDSEDGLSWAAFKHDGLSVGPFLNDVPGRSANGALRGLRDVPEQVEVGGYATYSTQPWWRVLAQAGQAVGGGGGQGGLLGKVAGELDYPLGRAMFGSTELTAHYAGQRFSQTYFGVDAQQAQASGLATYQSHAGFQDVTLSEGAQVPLVGNWSLLGGVSWIRLVGAAADSSLVRQNGHVNQAEVQTAIAYRFE